MIFLNGAAMWVTVMMMTSQIPASVQSCRCDFNTNNQLVDLHHRSHFSHLSISTFLLELYWVCLFLLVNFELWNITLNQLHSMLSLDGKITEFEKASFRHGTFCLSASACICNGCLVLWSLFNFYGFWGHIETVCSMSYHIHIEVDAEDELL